MRFFLLLCAISINTIALSQTTVIVKKIKSTIYVAADSRITYHVSYSDGRTNTRYDTMCKIWTDGKIGFAIVGMHTIEAKKIALELCAMNKSIDTVVKKFSNSFGTTLLRYLKWQQANFNSQYKQGAKMDSPYVSQVYFFGVRSGKAVLYAVQFGLNYNNLDMVNLSVKGTETDFAAGGQVKEIITSLLDNKTWQSEKDIPSKLYNLVMTEVKYHPDIVGAPIDVLKFTPTSYNWVRRQKKCKN